MNWSRIRSNDRVAVVGTTGSGKSTLLRFLVAAYPWVMLYDPKGEWEGAEWVTIREAAKLPRQVPPRLRYFPLPEELQDPEALDRFFWHAYYAQNLVVVVDEAYMATLSGRYMPSGYHAILAQGRSRGIGTFTATQRPYKIPQIILSEAEHWFVFRLNAPQDRNAVWQWTGIPPERVRKLDKRMWYYASKGEVEGPYILDIGGGNGASAD